jgi:hypothetical protein
MHDLRVLRGTACSFCYHFQTGPETYLADLSVTSNIRNLKSIILHLLARRFLAALIFSTLKMNAICSSETSVDTQRTTRRYIPEDSTLHNHRCENLKSDIRNVIFHPNTQIRTPQLLAVTSCALLNSGVSLPPDSVLSSHALRDIVKAMFFRNFLYVFTESSPLFLPEIMESFLC